MTRATDYLPLIHNITILELALVQLSKVGCWSGRQPAALRASGAPCDAHPGGCHLRQAEPGEKTAAAARRLLSSCSQRSSAAGPGTCPSGSFEALLLSLAREFGAIPLV